MNIHMCTTATSKLIQQEKSKAVSKETSFQGKLFLNFRPIGYRDSGKRKIH